MTTVDQPAAPLLLMTDSARACGTRFTLDALPHETGGIMLGWHDGGTIIVSDVLEVGDPGASAYGYIRNDSYAQKALDSFRADIADPRVGYVGEWHSHPSKQPPSSIDYATLRDIARETASRVAMAVFAASNDGSVIPYLVTAISVGDEVIIRRLEDERDSPAL